MSWINLLQKIAEKLMSLFFRWIEKANENDIYGSINPCLSIFFLSNIKDVFVILRSIIKYLQYFGDESCFNHEHFFLICFLIYRQMVPEKINTDIVRIILEVKSYVGNRIAIIVMNKYIYLKINNWKNNFYQQIRKIPGNIFLHNL